MHADKGDVIAAPVGKNWSSGVTDDFLRLSWLLICSLAAVV